MKPLSYFVNYHSRSGELFADMEESWGTTFEKLHRSQIIWLAKEAAYCLFEGNPDRFDKLEHDEEIQDACDRLYENSEADAINLLKFLVNIL
jgi:hypothetical protein